MTHENGDAGQQKNTPPIVNNAEKLPNTNTTVMYQSVKGKRGKRGKRRKIKSINIVSPAQAQGKCLYQL